PNIEVTPSGKLEVELDIETASSSLVPHVFDADGTSVMIHARADDYRTDPTGGAGARIACAVLSQPT
ncbi:MAG TPA: superoxide dismutase family protein, partial [Erythrobacter sp.]|nr:superoxide dismutase family protein [Erythrobacter sp.]